MAALRNLTLTSGFSLLLLFASSCEKTIRLDSLKGSYDGTYYETNDGQAKAMRLTAEMTDPAALTGDGVKVLDESGTELFHLRIDGRSLIFSDMRTKDQALIGPFPELSLTPKKKNLCAKSTGSPSLEFCISTAGLSVRSTDLPDGKFFSLSLVHAAAGNAAKPENATGVMTYDEAMTRSQTMNFTTEAEYRRVLQARFATKVAYLNMIPHLTINSIGALYAMDTASLLSSIGDLVPFILPSRWYQADQTVQALKSEKDAYQLVRLDSLNQTEGILYVYWRDQRILKLYTDTLDRSKKIRDEVKVREGLGQMAIGSTDSLNSVINFVEQNYLGTAGLLPEDLSGISQSLGYIEPTAVTSIEEDAANLAIDAQVATTPDLSYPDLKELALAHSPEVDQLAHFVEAAKDAKSAKLYEWLDPSGDPSLVLGFSMGANQKQSREQLSELVADQGQTVSTLYQKLFNAVTEYNLAIASYKKSVEGLTVQKRRFDQAIQTMAVGSKVDLLNLVQILQDYLTAAIAVETNVTQFRIANSKINRLLMKGAYSEVHAI